MGSHHRLSYTPLPDATPEGELDALAAVYSFVLRIGHDKKGAAEHAPEAAGRNEAEGKHGGGEQCRAEG